MTPDRNKLFNVSGFADNLRDSFKKSLNDTFSNFDTKKIGFSFRHDELSFLKSLDISFPKINIPDINYERLQQITDLNSNYGWTMTNEMNSLEYFEDSLLGMPESEMDDYFFKYYSRNNWENYHRMKNKIINNIENQWKELIGECFTSLENNNYKSIIPTLFTVIEGELSFMFPNKKKTQGFFDELNVRASSEKSEFIQIALYSISKCMDNHIYAYTDFSEKRKTFINRHWVLHGRDNPVHWKKVDAIRLLNVLSSLQFIKEIFNKSYKNK